MATPELSDEQRAAVDMARERRLCVITGPPGSGKTRLIAAICELDPDRTLLLAPTGSAAERLASCAAQRTLVIEKALHDRDPARLEGKPVVVDEAGMVSTELLLRIFRFLKPERLVLVGDPKQLPCVDGLPALHTLLQAPIVPRVELKTRWRRAGRAPGALDTCLETLGTPAFDLSKQDDSFRVVECDSQEECYAKAAAEYGSRECQMLAYTNAAVQRLNELTDDRARKQVHGVARVGDRVVCTENAYDKAKGGGKKLLVANGTCGTVREGSVRYDNGFVDAGFKRTKFAPCRAMTVNKSQGNEYEVHGVVVVAPWNGPPPLELMYTALSRFKVSVTVFVRKTQTRQVFFNEFRSETDRELVAELGDAVI